MARMTALPTAPDALAAPTLTELLGCRGSLPDIAAVALQDPIGDLDADGVFVACECALAAFCASDEALDLAYLCALFSVTPAAYLHITDPVLGFELDRRCAARLQGDDAGEPPEDGSVHFTTGGP